MQTNSHELTARQRVFVHTLATQGCTPTRAAAAAGFPWSKDAALRLLKDEAIQAAVRAERSRYAATELASIATATLKTVMDDAGAPDAARVEAARTIMAMVRELGSEPVQVFPCCGRRVQGWCVSRTDPEQNTPPGYARG